MRSVNLQTNFQLRTLERRRSLPLLPRGFRGSFLVGPGTAKLVHHAVVAFVASVFEILVSRLLPYGIGDSEGGGKRLRIFDPHLVIDRVLVGPRHTFRDAKSLTCWSAATVNTDARLVRKKIRRFDDQGIAFPTATGVSHVRENPSTGVRTPVERNNPRFVDHLLKDGHIARPLYDLGSVAIDYGKNGSRQTPRDAADIERVAVPVSALSDHVSRSLPLLTFRRERRHSAVLGLDDQRRLTRSSSGSFDPVCRWTGANVTVGIGEFLKVILGCGPDLGLSRRYFLVCQVKPGSHCCVSLQPHVDIVVAGINALQIGVTP